MTRYLVDTAVLIDLSKRIPWSQRLLDLIAVSPNEVGTTPLCLVEFYTGVTPGRRQDLDDMVDRLLIWEADRESALTAAAFRRNARSRGRQLSAEDALIAAVAHRLDAVVVTENLKDFTLTDIRVVSPKQAAAAP